jgi:hypothetical protein
MKTQVNKVGPIKLFLVLLAIMPTAHAFTAGEVAFCKLQVEHAYRTECIFYQKLNGSTTTLKHVSPSVCPTWKALALAKCATGVMDVATIAHYPSPHKRGDRFFVKSVMMYDPENTNVGSDRLRYVSRYSIHREDGAPIIRQCYTSAGVGFQYPGTTCGGHPMTPFKIDSPFAAGDTITRYYYPHMLGYGWVGSGTPVYECLGWDHRLTNATRWYFMSKSTSCLGTGIRKWDLGKAR